MTKRNRTRLINRAALICGALLTAVLVSWMAMMTLGIFIPLDGFKERVEADASRMIGRQVRINGNLALKPSPRPEIIAHDVSIESPSENRKFLKAGRIMARLDPLSLFQGNIHIVRLQIEAASVDLQAPKRIAHSPDLAEQGETNLEMYSRLLSTATEMLAGQPGFTGFALEKATLNYRVHGAEQPYQAIFEEVNVHARPGSQLVLTLRGNFQKKPYKITMTGGALENLLSEADPWPLQVSANISDTQFLVNGNVEVSGQEILTTFGLQIDWPSEYEHLSTGILPAYGHGQLALHAGHGIPVLSGELQLPSIDTVLSLGKQEYPAQEAATGTSPDPQAPPGSSITIPLAIRVAEVPFHGSLVMSKTGAESTAHVLLTGQDASAASLLEALAGITGIKGNLDQVRLQASLSENVEPGLLAGTGFALQVDGARLSYGNVSGGRSVDVSLDELTLTKLAGKAVTLDVQGALLDEPFSANLLMKDPGAMLAGEPMPVTLSAMGGGASLDINGSVSTSHADTATHLEVRLSGNRAGDSSAWLGISPCAETPYSLRGQLILSGDISRLQFLQAQTERTRLNGELDWSRDEQVAVLHAVLHFEELDPADIEMLIPLIKRDPDTVGSSSIAIDIPVLPAPVKIKNADIDLDIEHITSKLVDIADVSLSTQIREGEMQRSPFHARIDNIGIQGHLDQTAEETAVSFEEGDYDDSHINWADKLKRSAIHWAGNTAIIPLRWLFKRKFSGEDSADCRPLDAETVN